MSVQDRCMVGTRRTIGSEILLDAPMVLLGDQGQVQVQSGPFVDIANPDAR